MNYNYLIEATTCHTGNQALVPFDKVVAIEQDNNETTITDVNGTVYLTSASYQVLKMTLTNFKYKLI